MPTDISIFLNIGHVTPEEPRDLLHIAVIHLDYRQLVPYPVVFLEEIGRADTLQSPAGHNGDAIA